MKVYVVQFEFRDSITVDAVFDSLDEAKRYVVERGFKEIPEEEDLDYRVHGFCLEIEGCDPFPHEAGWAWIYVREIQSIADSAEDWNTRAVRTCRNTDTDDDAYFKCSECGAECSVEWCHSGWGTPGFCPNCGARVLRNTPKYSETGTKVVTDNKPVEVWQPVSADDVTCHEEEQ